MIIAPGWAPFSLIIFTNFLVSILEMATVLLLIKNSLKFVSFRQLLKVEGRSLKVNKSKK